MQYVFIAKFDGGQGTSLVTSGEVEKREISTRPLITQVGGIQRSKELPLDSA